MNQRTHGGPCHSFGFRKQFFRTFYQIIYLRMKRIENQILESVSIYCWITNSPTHSRLTINIYHHRIVSTSQEFRSGLAWMVGLSRSWHCGQDVGCNILKPWQRWRSASSMACGLHVCDLSSSPGVPLFRLCECPHDLTASFTHHEWSKQVSEEDTILFQDLVSEIVYCLFCIILFEKWVTKSSSHSREDI